jgi:hypothetical protein
MKTLQTESTVSENSVESILFGACMDFEFDDNKKETQERLMILIKEKIQQLVNDHVIPEDLYNIDLKPFKLRGKPIFAVKIIRYNRPLYGEELKTINFILKKM